MNVFQCLFLGLVATRTIAPTLGADRRLSDPHALPIPSWCLRSKPIYAASRSEEGRTIETRIYRQNSGPGGALRFSRIWLGEYDSLSDSCLWAVKDSVGPGMMSLEIFRKSVTIADIDGDGKAETFVGYTFRTDGADPIRTKFVAQKDGIVYAIEGAIPWMEDDADLYRMKYGAEFQFASPRFRQASDSLLKRFIVQGVRAGTFGEYLPYEMGGRRHQVE